MHLEIMDCTKMFTTLARKFGVLTEQFQQMIVLAVFVSEHQSKNAVQHGLDTHEKGYWVCTGIVFMYLF